MGARGGGGSRGGSGAGGARYTYLQESEKAVKVNLSLYAEYAPQGGFTSSMVRDKVINTEVWIPKSQMVKGEPSTWIMNAKAMDVANQKSPLNGRVLHVSNVVYKDAKGKVFKGAESAMTKKINAERKARYNAGVQRHDALVAQAKSMGIKGVRQNLTTAKLQQMIDRAK